jgi:hypothetical protein
MRSTRLISAATLAFALFASTAAHAQNPFRNDERRDGREDRQDFREQRFDKQRQQEERFPFGQSRSNGRFEPQRFDNRRDFSVVDHRFVDHRYEDHGSEYAR